MNSFTGTVFVILSLFLINSACAEREVDKQNALREGFMSPPMEARPRALWDWVDGNFQVEEITREMEEAARMGMGGFDIWDVRSVVDEAGIMSAGPPFMSDQYLEGICHAINEAERLGLDLGLIVASGWNAGGAWTLPQHQTMGLFKSELRVRGPGKQLIRLHFPELPDLAGKSGRQTEAFIPRNPDGKPKFYKEVAVLAFQSERDLDTPLIPGRVIDLSDQMDASGLVSWEIPEGEWTLVRYVCTNTGQPMISSAPNSRGPMIDHFSREASERHIQFFIDKLEEELGKSLGESGLTYLYTDSYEVQGQLWTPEMSDEFEKRMGYSLHPYIPALEGFIVYNQDITRRFLYDFRRVLSDLIIENHYAFSRELCEKHGIGFVAEAAGPGWPVHNCPFESLKSSGSLSFPRGEFWHMPENSPFWTSQKGTEQEKHFLEELQVIKGVASASHIYNQKYVEAEAFTGTHLWNEGPGDLKPTADRAFCEGLNRLNFHTWPHTPEEAGTPGWVYAFGTLINEHRIWWPMAKPWMDYLGRCSYLLQQGEFVGDVLFYYGDSVPNFVPAKKVLPDLGFGYDYDVCNSDILLNKLEVQEGKLVLPHGQSYEILSLPAETYMQPEILEKIEILAEAGARVIGPKPNRSNGLHNWEQRDQQVREIADRLWDQGKVIDGSTLRSILENKGIGPDFDFRGEKENTSLDYIHRTVGETDLYFVRNRTGEVVSGTASFRQHGKQVELWDPANGKMYGALPLNEIAGHTDIPLSLEAYESVFVVFTSQADGKGLPLSKDLPFQYPLSDRLVYESEIGGDWKVLFPEASAGIGETVFDTLVFWNQRKEDGIRFFSGIATYEKEFTWEKELKQGEYLHCLEFDQVVEVSHVYLNGQDLGIIWKKPFRIDISDALRKGSNALCVEVANTWANGLAGDARLPAAQRRTKTNVTRLPNAWTYPLEEIPNENYDLIEGGIAGPVKISTFRSQTKH
ncbi:MAG: glycosyl hydrolase [Bacteroidota bacterium]